MSSVPPVRREIVVEADQATAFEVFTARLGQWWPLAGFSVYGEGGTVSFDDGQIVERAADGRSAVWGTVTRWEPPAAVSFSWHPGRSAERTSHVEVTFTAVADQTRVTLVHQGWDAYDDPAAARAEYDQGWPTVLDHYRGALAGDGAARETAAGETWVALLHRPGPAAPTAGTLFEDPRFAEHVAFLNRMAAAGYLVAAGPLTDRTGEGMTVLRLPGAGRLEAATRLATEDDTSVAGGFLDVTVRPWQVMMHAR
jgi:uncharacterized protein YciI